MTLRSKATILGIISFLVVIGFSVPATTYAWYGPTYFNYNFDSNYGGNYGYGVSPSYYPATSYSGYSKPKEQLVVYAWGPTSAPAQPPSYYPPQKSYNYNSYTMPQTYSYPQYAQYNYPQYSSYSYQPPYGGGYPQATGGKDLWGNQLCNWGSDYRGYPCDRDPHQWIYDPYTGTYY